MAQTRKVRVLHVITRMIVGGAQENTLFTAALQTKNPRYDVTLLTGVDDGPEGDLLDAARAQSVRLQIEPLLVRPIRPFVDLRAFLMLRRFMKNGRFDIVHTHSSKAGILGRMAAYSGQTMNVSDEGRAPERFQGTYIIRERVQADWPAAARRA